MSKIFQHCYRSFLVTAVFSAGFLAPKIAESQELTTARPALPTEPVPLDWRKVPWPAIDYERLPLKGGGGLYVVRSPEARKFSLSVIFPGGVYSSEQKLRPTLGAYVDLLLEGGTQLRTFEALQQFVQENGINLRTNVASDGAVTVSMDGLTGDYDKAVKLLAEILKRPAFRKDAFDTWKRNKKAEFERLLDAKSTREQYRLLEPFMIRSLLGSEHYFATFLERSRPKTIDAIRLEDVAAFHSKIVTQRGVLAMIAGGVKAGQIQAAQALLSSLPKGDPSAAIFSWLPDRSAVPASAKVSVTVINKPDMPQSSVVGRIHMTDTGELNTLEQAELAIAKDVFSSASGVVGEDRFSGALRKRSGLSYSAGAQFDSNAISPNTNESSWNMIFQTPADKTAEGITLAWETWTQFRSKGITNDEFRKTRTVLMNKMLSGENPVLQKAAMLLSMLAEGKVPSTTPDEDTLARLEAVPSSKGVNELLLRLTASPRTRAAFALIGGISDAEAAAIRKLRFVDKVTVVPFDQLKKDLL
jgi:predicted Zn-dependent peptidase